MGRGYVRDRAWRSVTGWPIRPARSCSATRGLLPVPGLEEIRLQLADEALPIWHAAQLETGDPDAPMTYWAFAWAGGLAIARYLEEHPDAVAGRRVLDFASGSGVCAIAAMRAGAADVVAVDIDAIAVAAIKLNSKANRVRVSASRRTC